MKAKMFCSTFVGVAMLSMAPLELSAKTLGMVANGSTDGLTIPVTVFDADTHVVLGTVFIAAGGFNSDVLITPDLKRGFVTNFNSQVFVIDLTTSPPSLAGGTNPIPISNVGLDLSISPDGKFLVVSDGNSIEPISIIDIVAQAEISTFSTGEGTTSVEVCTDGSVLAASFLGDTVRRLTLSGAGTLTDTGEVLSVIAPMNVYCAPDAQSGVVIQLLEGVTSFTIPGLSAVDTRPLSGTQAFTGTINPTGNRVFARSSFPESIDVFDFTQATGALGDSLLLTFPVGGEASPSGGIDQTALHSNGGKLFVSERSFVSEEPSAVKVYNSETGALLASITDPHIVGPTSVTVMTQVDPCALPPPPEAIVGTNGPDILNGTSGNDKIFGLGGADSINGGSGSDLICGGVDSDSIKGGPGNDTIDGGTDNDAVNGDTGNDTVKGGSGSDSIIGGAGNDVLNTQDGVSGNDSVNGGPGSDICTVDAGDVVSSCNP
jgi:Ca2+-binding RTX toxin-like protein